MARQRGLAFVPHGSREGNWGERPDPKRQPPAVPGSHCVGVCSLIDFSMFALRRSCSHTAKFQFHLVSLPAAYFFSDEKVGVIAEIARTVATWR
jgi:hypothetical protein